MIQPESSSNNIYYTVRRSPNFHPLMLMLLSLGLKALGKVHFSIKLLGLSFLLLIRAKPVNNVPKEFGINIPII